MAVWGGLTYSIPQHLSHPFLNRGTSPEENWSQMLIASHLTSILILIQAWQFFKFFTISLAHTASARRLCVNYLVQHHWKWRSSATSFYDNQKPNTIKFVFIKRYTVGNESTRYEANDLITILTSTMEEGDRLLCPWDSPDKHTGVGRHSLLQGVFLTQEWKPDLLHCRQILYCLSHQGSP